MKEEEFDRLEMQLKTIGTSLKDVERIYPKITEKIMPLSITGVSARNYFNWKKEGLIPESEESTNDTDRSWVRLNLIEYVWIKIVQSLREFGVPIDTIRISKTMMFENWINILLNNEGDELEDFIDFLKTETGIKKDKIEAIRSFLIENKQDILNQPKEFEIFTTLIGGLVSSILLCDDQGSIIITKENGEFDVNFFTYKSLDDFKNYVMPLLENPHIQIPIKKLIENFFDDEKSEKYIDSFDLLNLKERKVIEAIRKGEFKEIIIKQDFKNKDIIIELEKDGDILDQKAKEIRRILGLNDYSEVNIKYRNDKNLYFTNKTRL